MIRFYIVLLTLGIGVMQYQLWAGPSSWFRYVEMKRDLAEQRLENDRLRATNEALAAELYSLEHNQDAVEARARYELNMIKPGERLFRVESVEDVRRGGRQSEPIPQLQVDVKPGSAPTFEPKKGSLYHARINPRPPTGRDRR